MTEHDFAPRAASWLQAITNENLSLAMARHDIIVDLRLWLVLPILSSSRTFTDVFGQIVDAKGDDHLGCPQDPITCVTSRCN